MVYKAAIIGCGNIAGKWNENPNIKGILTHAKAYEVHKDTKLVACADINQKRAREFATRWKVPKFYDKHLALLKADLDILSICTNVESHYEILKDAFENARNLKAVLLEKPMCRNVDQAKDIVKMCDEYGVILNINYTRRFDKNHVNVKEIIAKEKLGEIQTVNAYYSKGIWNNGSHLINLLHYYFGEIEKITILDNIIENDEDPTPSFFIKFNDTKGFISGLMEKYYSIFEIDIFGTKGRINIGDFGNLIKVFGLHDDKIYPGYTNLETEPFVKMSTLDQAMYNYLDNTIKAIDEKVKPTCDARVGLNDLIAINEILKYV